MESDRLIEEPMLVTLLLVESILTLLSDTSSNILPGYEPHLQKKIVTHNVRSWSCEGYLCVRNTCREEQSHPVPSAPEWRVTGFKREVSASYGGSSQESGP